MRVRVDTNVLYDFLAGRTPFVSAATAVWAAAEEGRFEGVVSAISFATLFYLGRKTLGTELAMEGVRRVHRIFEVAEVDQEVVNHSVLSRMADFEDAIQTFSAVRARATHIVTRDLPGFNGAPLPILTPAEFIAQLR